MITHFHIHSHKTLKTSEYPLKRLTTRDEPRRVQILVQTHLSVATRKLSLNWVNNKQPRHSSPHRHTYTHPLFTCRCELGNASATYYWPNTVTTSWWDCSGGFRLRTRLSSSLLTTCPVLQVSATSEIQLTFTLRSLQQVLIILLET